MIDIIIVNYNSSDYLRTCLTSVYENLDGCHANVHVIDNNSQDNVLLVKNLFPQINLSINSNNLGFSIAVNKIIRKTSAPYILLLNPDTIDF